MTGTQVTPAEHSHSGDRVDGVDAAGGGQLGQLGQLHPTPPLFPSAGGQYHPGTPDYHGQ